MKKLLSLLVVTAMALGIVGCGGKTEPKKEENISDVLIIRNVIT